jgi:PAS domain-containing protein
LSGGLRESPRPGAAAIEQGKGFHTEHRIVQPDGTMRWVVESGEVIRVGPDQTPRLVCAIVDVTAEHRRAEEKMLLEKELQETQS